MTGVRLFGVLFLVSAANASQVPSGLLMDLKLAPHTGVDRSKPTISWIVPHLDGCDAAPFGQMQSHFQVQLAASQNFSSLLVDSQRISSNLSSAVQWPGPALRPVTTYWWRVRTWTPEGCRSDWSDSSKIVTGNFGNEFQAAKPVWVSGASYVFLRKAAALKSASPIISAHVFIAATPVGDNMEKYLGAYRLYVNGLIVGTGPGRSSRKYSDPGHPDYDTLDVSAMLSKQHELTIAIQSYGSGKIIAELHVVYDDNSTQVVGTDASWSAFNADKLFGKPTLLGAVQGPQENIDASLSPSDDGCMTCWRLPSFVPTAAWHSAEVQTSFAPALNAKMTPAITVTESIEPANIIEVVPGHWFFDFGTEMMAGLALEWTGGDATLNIRASEELVTNTSILFPMRTGNKYEMNWKAGNGTSSFEQHEYWEFRYGEIKATPASADETCDFVPPQLDEKQTASFHCPHGQTIANVTFSSYGTPSGACTGHDGNTFQINKECHASSSQSVVESLCLGKQSCSFQVSNTIFGQDPCHKTPKGFAGAVQCSGGQAMISSGQLPFKLTAWVVRYPWVETDSSFNSSSQMLNDVWQLCRNTLKVTSLDTTTDSNTRERLPYEADGFITGSSRYVLQREYAWQRHSTLVNLLNPTWPTEWRQTIPLLVEADYMMTGDLNLAKSNWDFVNSSSQAHCIDPSSGLLDFSQCSRPAGVRDIVDWPQAYRDGYEMTDVNTVNNAYTVGALKALSNLAEAMDMPDATTYSKRAAGLSKAMLDNLFDNSTGLFVDGRGKAAASHSAWHAQVFPLFFQAGGATQSSELLNFLKSKRMTGSVYAAFAFLMGIYNIESDHGAFALEMMTNCDENSWCHMLRVGATAVMEAWSRKGKPNLSWSHPWATAPATAIAHGLMGIKALAPAYRHFEVRPQPGNLSWAEIKLPVLSGFISARVDQSSSAFKLALSVPGNTEATVCLPALGESTLTLSLDGKSATGYQSGDYVCLARVGSGTHSVVRTSVGEIMI